MTIAFRMSPEENEELNNRVKLSGFRTKQDYIIQSVLHQKVVATGNPLMLVQFRQNLQRIEHELERIEKESDMDGELLTPSVPCWKYWKVSRNSREHWQI